VKELTILCITNGREFAGRFIQRMFDTANRIQARLILGLDGEKAQAAGYPCHASMNLQAVSLQEDVADEAVKACPDGWILRIDDDEVISPALEKWLKEDGYLTAKQALYAFPRVYMWGDEKHILVNDGMWPDLQTRLGWKPYMLGYSYVHAGNPNGTGAIVPYAIEHHKLLVLSHEERKEISYRYENLRPGAGTLPQYARYNLPEMFYEVFETKEYTDGDYRA